MKFYLFCMRVECGLTALKDEWREYLDPREKLWRKLLEEYDNLYTPSNIMVIKSMKVRWEGNVAHMEDACEMCTKF